MKTKQATFLSTLCATGLILTAPAQAAAFRVLSGAENPGVNISITAQESEKDHYDYEFVIENHSFCHGATATGIYFESQWDDLFSDSPFDRNLNLGGPPNFREGDVTPDIPGWSDSLVSYEILMRSTEDETFEVGFESGQTAVIAFVANDNVTLQDVIDALSTSGHGIALRIQEVDENDALAEGFALADINYEGGHAYCDDDNGPPSIPTPGTASLSIVAMALASMRRRR